MIRICDSFSIKVIKRYATVFLSPAIDIKYLYQILVTIKIVKTSKIRLYFANLTVSFDVLGIVKVYIIYRENTGPGEFVTCVILSLVSISIAKHFSQFGYATDCCT